MKYLVSLIIVSNLFFGGLALAQTSTPSQTANATLIWDSNIESDIAKYIMFMGISSGVYDSTLDVLHVPLISKQSGNFLKLAEGQTYYFAVKACDVSGNCSGFSNEVSKLIAIPPRIPGNLGVTIDVNITITIP